MTRNCWAVVTFGLGVALAPLVHHLGTECLYSANAVAQEEPFRDAAKPTLTPVFAPKRTVTEGKLDEFVPNVEPDSFNKRNDAASKVNTNAAVAQERAAGTELRPTSGTVDEPKARDVTKVIRRRVTINGVETWVTQEVAAMAVTEAEANLAEMFLELAKQKAALLTPEEMAREVDSLRKELTELSATVQLREAVGKLKQLIGEHPQTQAAQRAKRMLDVEAAPSEPTPPATYDNGIPLVDPQPPRRELGPANSLPTY